MMIKIIVKMMFDVNDDDYSELISVMMMMILSLMMMSKALNSSSFLCDCKIKCKPCGQGRILSSTALCGLILIFIFSVKAIGHVVHYVSLYKVYIKITADVWCISY